MTPLRFVAAEAHKSHERAPTLSKIQVSQFNSTSPDLKCYSILKTPAPTRGKRLALQRKPPLNRLNWATG